MMKKFIVLDLDGTLLSEAKDIDQSTLAYLQKLLLDGYLIAYASGRRYNNAECYVRQLFADNIETGYVVCCDGCYIYDCKGNLLETSPLLCGKDLQFIFSVSQNEHCNFRFYSLEADYAVYNRSFYMKSMIKRLVAGKFKTTREVRKVNALDLGNFKNIEKVVLEKREGSFSEECCVALKDKYNFHRMSNQRLEIQRKGINKAYAIGHLLTRTGLSWGDVIFFGDDANDHCMLDTGCFVVAMGNADNAMKQKANYVTHTNNEQGVLKALKKLDLI